MNFSLMRDFMDRLTAWRIPGNVISVYKDGAPVFEYASGYSDLESGERMTSDKFFYMYSCSKVATTLAALQLYEKGYFLLNDPISEFLPAFRDMYVKTGKNGEVEKAKSPITMRQLFTMTAGFNYDRESPAFQKAEELTNGKYDTVPTINCLARQPLDFEPGAHWQYSLCHDVLAAVVEVISGKKFRDYMEENIFAPVGMKATFEDTPEVHKKMCTQYRFVDETGEQNIVALQQAQNARVGGHIEVEGFRNGFALGSEYDSGGAGIITSAPEYAKLMGALANGGITKSGERVISRGTMELWRTNQLNDVQKRDFNWAQFVGYGYGLGVRTMTDRAVSGSNGPVGEFGWNGAAGAGSLIDPENNVAFFYAAHMLNNQEAYVQPRLRNVLYTCLENA